jgi:hypothetical protein
VDEWKYEEEKQQGKLRKRRILFGDSVVVFAFIYHVHHHQFFPRNFYFFISPLFVEIAKRPILFHI